MKKIPSTTRKAMFYNLLETLERIANISEKSTVFEQEAKGFPQLDIVTLKKIEHRFNIYSQEDISELKIALFNLDWTEEKSNYFSKVDDIAKWCTLKYLGIYFKPQNQNRHEKN